MRRLNTICLAGSILLFAVSTVNALITVDPDAFPDGTVLNNAYPHVTLSALGSYDGADGNVYARTNVLASTGTNVFGSSWEYDPEWGFDASFQPHLRVDFDPAAMWVAIDAIGNNSEDYGRLEAYDSVGSLIDVYETGHLVTGNIETMAITAPDIAYVLVAGKNPAFFPPHHTVHLDNLRFETLIKVPVDIKPHSCQNPLNVNSQGVLPVAILGMENFDVSEVDVAVLEGVPPVKISYKDVAAPVGENADECECTEAGPDGYLDLVLHFDTQEIVETLGSVLDGEVFPLFLTGVDVYGIPIEGADCVRIIKKGKNQQRQSR